MGSESINRGFQYTVSSIQYSVFSIQLQHACTRVRSVRGAQDTPRGEGEYLSSTTNNTSAQPLDLTEREIPPW